MPAMTRDYVLWNLREAATALVQLMEEMNADPNYSEAEFSVDMAHLYHHVNTAWNARAASMARIEKCSADDFNRWRQFPKDLDLTATEE